MEVVELGPFDKALLKCPALQQSVLLILLKNNFIFEIGKDPRPVIFEHPKSFTKLVLNRSF